MAILNAKQKLSDLFIEEYLFYQSIVQNPLRTTTGAASYTNPRTSATYSVVTGGQNELATYMFETNPILKNYTFADTDYSSLRNWSIQNEYQTPTVVSRQIRVSKPSDSAIIRFKLGAEITGGNITISTDGGATELPLRLGDEVTNVTELAQGLYEVVYATSFFILRSSGGLKSFFGDGSDGTIPDLNVVTTAPNGGTVSNLWDMNAGTVFATGTLSSASDQVVFSIDFGKQILFASSGNTFFLYSASISTGVARTLSLQYSDDSLIWVESYTSSITTSPTDNSFLGHTSPHRYWRTILKSGGSNCTLSIQGITINKASADTQTTKVFRILEPSTLNGAEVIKQYTTYTLPVGYEHTTQNPCQGLIIYSQGIATVNGVLDMSQKAGLAPNGNTIPMIVVPEYTKTSKTSSLLHFDNNITDANGRTWTNNGSATFDATNKKFGTHAISFNGTSQWIDTPASDDFTFGEDEFTIDMWVRPTSFTTGGAIFAQRNANDNFGRFSVIYTTGGKIQTNVYTGDGTTTLVAFDTVQTLTLNTWSHVVITKFNGAIRIFINGVLDVNFGNIVAMPRCFAKPTIGRLGENSSLFVAGQIDEFRIIKGKAMYTANFTPPTSAYTYQATITDTVEAFKEYYKLTTVLQNLRGGYGGNGGYGGGYSGSTGRQTSVGIGGAGRQNLGGFGGGGSGGASPQVTSMLGGIGGSILNSEIGGGSINYNLTSATTTFVYSINGINGCGGIGMNYLINTNLFPKSGIALGGGSGGTGGTSSVSGNSSSDSQYSGGFACLICGGNIVINGAVRANGGAGSNGSNGAGSNTGGGGGGGGAGGGVIAIFHKGTYTNNGIVQANGGTGGTGGAGVGTGEAGGTASSGSANSPHIQQL